MMTEQDIRAMRKLDELAEEAGGYVVPPHLAAHSKKFEEDFSLMRKYCIDNKKTFSELTDKDYELMGIRAFQ